MGSLVSRLGFFALLVVKGSVPADGVGAEARSAGATFAARGWATVVWACRGGAFGNGFVVALAVDAAERFAAAADSEAGDGGVAVVVFVRLVAEVVCEVFVDDATRADVARVGVELGFGFVAISGW